MTEEERIAITKHHIRHLLLVMKLKVDPPEGVKDWVLKHWNLSDDAQLRQYRNLWQQVDKEMQDGQRGQQIPVPDVLRGTSRTG